MAFLILIDDLPTEVQDPIAYMYFSTRQNVDPCIKRRARTIESKQTIDLVQSEVKHALMRPRTNVINTWQELDAYCDASSGTVLAFLEKQYTCAKSKMLGRFLQRMDMIANMHHDITKKRCLWPKVLWSRFVPSTSDLCNPDHRFEAIRCMNEFLYQNLVLFHAHDLCRGDSLGSDGENAIAANTFANRLVLMGISLMAHTYNNYDAICSGESLLYLSDGHWHTLCSCHPRDFRERLIVSLRLLARKCIGPDHAHMMHLVKAIIASAY